MHTTPKKLAPALTQAGALSLGLGCLGLSLAVFLTTLYFYTTILVLAVLAILFGIYGITRIFCAFSTAIPDYIKVIAAYIGTTLWLTLGITLSVFSGGTLVVLWAILSVPIVCDFLLTTVSSLDKSNQGNV